MTEPIRIRAKVAAGVTDVHVLMPHPMETGLRRNESGAYVPAHYIKDVRIEVAGRIVLAATLGRGVSADPLLHFRFAGGVVGDRISVAWTDSSGERRADEAVLA